MCRAAGLSLMIIVALTASVIPSPAQGTSEIYMPFDPSNTNSQIPFEFDSYYFAGGHRFYALNASYFYGIPNGRHRMGITVPVVHNIFNADFAGYENTTGIGDLRFVYMGVPYIAKKDIMGLKRVAAYLEVTTPTGNERLGRGVGSWLYMPGIIATYQPDIHWYIFPEVRFQFSTRDVNTQGGSNGIPDQDDPSADEQLQTINVSLPTTYVLEDWDGWIGLGADYSYTFVEDTYFLFLRIDVGKMISDKTAAGVQLTRFIAGQPRLETIFRAKIAFFLR
jgi:hypothetical protein